MRLEKKPSGRLFNAATEATVLQSSFLEYFRCSRPGEFTPDFVLGSCLTSSDGVGRSEIASAAGVRVFSVVGGTTSALAGETSGSELFAEGYSRDAVV